MRACESMLRQYSFFISPDVASFTQTALGLPEDQLSVSLTILDESGDLKLSRTTSGGYRPSKLRLRDSRTMPARADLVTRLSRW